MEKKHIHVYYCESCKEGSSSMELLYARVKRNRRSWWKKLLFGAVLG